MLNKKKGKRSADKTAKGSKDKREETRADRTGRLQSNLDCAWGGQGRQS